MNENKLRNFIYNNNSYDYYYNPNDLSGNGCFIEIVKNDEYKLTNYMNLNNFIIDIGGNSGICTIILAKQNPKATILTFEPDINLYNNICKNVELNNLFNVKVFNKAVTSSDNNIVTLSIFPGMSGANTIYANEQFNNYTNDTMITTNVETISFDTIIIENNINSIELLKIDCEGAEYDIIYNSIKFKENIVKNIIGEFHNMKYVNTLNNSTDLLNYCKLYINKYIRCIRYNYIINTVLYLHNIIFKFI
jgi:FkbM family methyltransferase